MHRFPPPQADRLLAITALVTTALAFCTAPTRAHAQDLTGLTPYEIGTPSGDATEILAYINRARANPPAEGQRLADGPSANYPSSGIGSISELLTSFSSYPPRPPLAFNADLDASAKAHTAEMAATGIEQHNSSDGTPSGYRIKSFGYDSPDGENIQGGPSYPTPYRVLPWTTESGYETDTRNVVAGSIGHRLAIMEPTYPGAVEIGVASSADGIWNTEDFGANQTPPLLLGAVFTDDDGSGVYASGEGVASVVVTAPGASSFYAVTRESGAYTLPLDLVPAYQICLDPIMYTYAPLASGPPPTVTVVFTDALGNVTTKNVTLTHTPDPNGNPVYYDAQMNVRYDNAEVDLARIPPATGHPAFFNGEVSLGGGVYYRAFSASGTVFGYYAYLSDPSYLYHFDLGYEYVIDAQDGRSGVYLYDFTSSNWFYTSPGFPFPYLYDFSLNALLYYYPDLTDPGHYNTDGVRWFYNYATGKFLTL